MSTHEPFLHFGVTPYSSPVQFWFGLRETTAVSRARFAGRVGEWLKPADCKSAAPCGLRRFESSPVHQRPAGSQPIRPLADKNRAKRFCFAAKVWDLDRESAAKFSSAALGAVSPAALKKLTTEVRSAGKPVRAWVAQLVERVLGKDEVTGSIPVPGSRGRGCGLYLQPAGDLF